MPEKEIDCRKVDQSARNSKRKGCKPTKRNIPEQEVQDSFYSKGSQGKLPRLDGSTQNSQSSSYIDYSAQNRTGMVRDWGFEIFIEGGWKRKDS